MPDIQSNVDSYSKKQENIFTEDKNQLKLTQKMTLIS